jgi:hypothetical protein
MNPDKLEQALNNLAEGHLIADSRRQEWDVWGRAFTKYILEVFQDSELFTKSGRPKGITRDRLAEAFEIVAKASHLWESKLTHWTYFHKVNGTEESLKYYLKEIFLDYSNFFKKRHSLTEAKVSGTQVNKLPYLSGSKRLPLILYYHFKYFAPRAILKALAIIFDQKVDTIKKTLQRHRQHYKKHNFLAEYRDEVLIYVNSVYQKIMSWNENIYIKVVEETNKILEWCKAQEKLKPKKSFKDSMKKA